MGCFLKRPKLKVDRKKKFFIEGTKDDWGKEVSWRTPFKLSFHFKLKCFQVAESYQVAEKDLRFRRGLMGRSFDL